PWILELALDGRPVFVLEPPHDLLDALDALDVADTMTGGPDVLPRLWLLLRIMEVETLADLEIVRVEPGIHEARAQLVGVSAGDRIGADDILGGAVDHHLLVTRVGAALMRGDEARAHIDEIGSHDLGGAQGSPVRHAARDDDHAFPELAHRG